MFLWYVRHVPLTCSACSFSMFNMLIIHAHHVKTTCTYMFFPMFHVPCACSFLVAPWRNPLHYRTYTVMDRSLGHPHSMGQGAFLASTTANVPIFWVEYINITALNLHRKPHKITSKGSWVIWERVYFGAQNNFLDSFPRLLCIADGINLIFKCRIQWKALDTLNICKNFDGNRARFHEDTEKTVKSAARRFCRVGGDV